MRGTARALACLWILGIASCAAGGAGQSPRPTAGAEAQAEEVLVMLPTPPPHFRPGTNYGGGYDEQPGREARRRIARDLSRTRGMELVTEWPMPSLGVDCFLMRLPRGQPAQAVVDSLAGDPRVAWAQVLNTYRSLGPGDPLLALQPTAASWHLAELHTLATGRDVSVAELDSGVEVTHPDLAGQVSIAQNFVDGSAYAAESHGTAVAGIIAARADNGIGIVGIAPGARLLALRACWQTEGGATLCNSFTLAKALQFALSNGAQVINLSLTGPDDRLLRRLVDAALARGVAVVGAVDPHAADGGFPASYPGVIAVAADDTVIAIDAVRAPAAEVPATLPGARWGFVTGTSFAAAQVTGSLALLRELAPAMTPAQARSLLLSATVAPAGDQAGGATDVCAVVARAAAACSCICSGRQDPKVAAHR